MQFESDVDLAKAIEAPELMMDGLLEVDWNRDGGYSHAYSDMSWLATRVLIDAGPIGSDLPTEVNGIAGFASSQITITFGGVRYSNPDVNAAWAASLAERGVTAVDFFDAFNMASPIYGKVVEGTPVRYTRVVSTSGGDKPVVQFTGALRDISLDELAETITITGSDVEDLAGALVTLPVWAIGPTADHAIPYNDSGEFSPDHPIDAAWIWEECLRSAGRGYGPMPRPDAVAYFTCHGSFLPSVGTLAGQYPVLHDITYEGDWEVQPWGLGHKYASFNDNGKVSGGEAWTSELVAVPPAPVVGPTQYVAFAGWFRSDGVLDPGGGFEYTEIGMALDSGTLESPGYCSIDVYKGGRVVATVFESPAGSGPNAGAFKQWYWNGPLAAGYHYICVTFTFTASAITAQMRVDDAVVSVSSTGGPGGGFNYASPPPTFRTNKVAINAREAPVQHIQIYAGASAATYDPNQKYPRWHLDGKPAPSSFTRSRNEIVWIPNTVARPVWDVLKESTSAEFGILHTDEFGIPHFLSRDAVGAPTAFGFDVTVKKTITRDKVQGIRVKPSSDRYRNAISMSSTFTRQVRKIVWQSSDPKQFYSRTGDSHTTTIDVSDIVGIRDTFVDLPAAASPQVPDLNVTSASAVRADDVNTDAPAGWVATVLFAHDQRSIEVLYGSASSGAPVYIGSLLGAQSPNFMVGGHAYDAKQTKRQVLASDVQIAARGMALLDIPDSPWRQTPNAVGQMMFSLILATLQPLPIIDNITITADPRLQLRDFIMLEAASAWFYCQIIGIRRNDGPDGSLDTLTLRVAAMPNTWILDDQDLSILDTSTILA